MNNDPHITPSIPPQATLKRLGIDITMENDGKGIPEKILSKSEREKKLERERDVAMAEVVALRAALEKCFWHLQKQITARSLKATAQDGTQSLSKHVAGVLDDVKLRSPATAPEKGGAS